MLCMGGFCIYLGSESKMFDITLIGFKPDDLLASSDEFVDNIIILKVLTTSMSKRL